MSGGTLGGAAVILLGLVLCLWLPDHVDAYHVTLASLILINVMLAVSLQVTNGLTGLFSLGHPAFMTIGGYLAAILTYPARRKGFMMPELPGFLAGAEWALLPALAVGALGAGLVALVVGVAVLRLRGHYLAVATLGLIVIVRVVANNLDGWTRGGLGLSGVPRLTDLATVWLATSLTIALAWRLKHASIGRAMMAVRENEMAARCMGIDAFGLKLVAFVAGAVLAGIAGALTVHQISVITPASYGIPLAFNLVVMIVVGGLGSITGAVLAAVTLSVLAEMLKPLEESLGLYGLSQLLMALLLILVLRFRPKGLFGSAEPWRPRAAGSRAAPCGGGP